MQRFDTLNPINHNLARPIVFMFYDDDDQQYKYIIIFIFIWLWSGAEHTLRQTFAKKFFIGLTVYSDYFSC